jgi:exodeoxyribonuclease VII small subunit
LTYIAQVQDYPMTNKKPGDGGSVPTDIQKMDFEEAFKNLEEIVSQLEDGSVGLEASIGIYARGMHLKRHCESKLTSAREQVEMIVADSEGGLSTEPANTE